MVPAVEGTTAPVVIPGTRRERVAWCMFDFANSAFPTIAMTAFGGPYFIGVLADGGVDLGPLHLGPATAWGAAIASSMALVTLTSPVMGAIADRSGKKRALLTAYVVLCVAATVGLAFVPPGAGLAAFALYVVASFAFEGAYVFYNAFLPEITTPDRIGRLSGYGWGLGYVGGLLALILARPLVPPEYDAAHAGRGSLVYLVVAAWYAVFAAPAILFLRDRNRHERPPEAGYLSDAFRTLRDTFRHVRRYRVVVVFLVAFFLFNDAIVTVIEFTGVYTKEVLGFGPADNTMLFLVLNVIAAPGALVFGFVVDRFGGRNAILWSLVVWVAVIVTAYLTTTKGQFWIVAVLAALVIGATQASSRALMAKLAPRHRVGEFMGFLALSGKASAVFGPLLYGVVAEAYDHRVAILTIGQMFVVAFFVMLAVNEKEGAKRAAEEEAA